MYRMKQVTFLLMAAVIPALGTPVFAKNPELVPAALETCGGATWSGLTMGRTTARDIKKQFRTGRSDLPMSQELSQPREARQKVFALYSDKHDDSLLSVILLRYSDDGPDLAALGRAMGAQEQDYYQNGRLEDWKLATFPSKGIVAFELTVYGRQTVPLIVLCAPSGVAAVCRGFSTSRQPVVERSDPHANEPRVMEFGTAAVNTDLKGLELNTGERQDVERTMIDTTAGGTMRYRVGAPGSYTTEVRGNFTPEKGGSLSVTSTISGFGPYGPISVSGSSDKSLPAVKDMATAYSGVNSTNYTIALYEALEKASSSFRDAMIASGPPPIQTVRLQKWQGLVEDFRAQRQATSDYIPAVGGFAGTPSRGGGGPAERPLSPLTTRNLKPPVVAPASFAPASVVPSAPAQSLFTFANGAQAVGTLISFDGSTYTVSTTKGMRQFKKAAIVSIRTLTAAPGAAAAGGK